MRNLFLATAAAVTCVPTVALADSPVVQAVQLGHENVRYAKGVPTVDLEQRGGAVQIRPLPMDHGSYVFSVAVYNDGDLPADMDIADVVVTSDSQPVGVQGVDRLIKKAKHRAFWSQLGVAMLGGLAAGAASSERDTYYSSYHSRYSSYHSYFSAPSLAGQLEADRITDETGAALAGMQAQLDATSAALSDQVMQLSTVDPGGMYAGKVVLEKIRVRDLPQDITITVNWNGEQYPFAFRLAKAGTPAPTYTQMVRAERPASAVASASAPAPGEIRQSPVPRGVDMDAIVRRTAQVMPKDFALDSGTKLTSYSALGPKLIITAQADPSIYSDPESWQAAASSELCAAKPFAAILYQGGAVQATYSEQGRKQLGTIEVSGDSCRSARRGQMAFGG